MTGQAVEQRRLTKPEARDLTQEVRDDLRALWAKVLDLYEGGAHLALGYESWAAYWRGEFGQSGARGEQLVRAGRVVRALSAGREVLDVPLPASDLVARELVPVFRTAPDDLPEVWARAVGINNGRPTAKQVRELVQPYRDNWERGRPHDPASWQKRGATKRTRNLAGVPLIQAHAQASNAHANIGAALDAGTPVETLTDWLGHADDAARLLAEVAARIRAHLQPTTKGSKG